MPDSAWLTAPSAIAGPSSFRPGGARRVAVVHEWLASYAGSERVVREILAIYPEADLFGVVDFLSDADRARLFGKTAKTTFIQRLPFARKKFRGYLPLMPLAVEQFDLSGFDLVISSSHAVAKGVLTGPDQFHICYCHTPIRYAWDMQHQYLRQAGLRAGAKSIAARLALHYIRLWDTRTASGVDRFIANSAYVARRIKKAYGRGAEILYPPVDVEAFALGAEKADFYLAASRLVPYKRIDLIVRAFASLPERRLVVIGDGPEMPRLAALAGPNVTLLGFQEDAVLRDHLQRARAFIFAAEEDFGILPVEAQACGTPVIAFNRGGAAETIMGLGNRHAQPPTGVFFESQTSAALLAAIARFETAEISPQACRRRAEQFSIGAFRAGWAELAATAAEAAAEGREQNA
jgi:glycosyltransferase involved in cell wall biosynthesis